jgi:hypothetical protein
MVVSTSGYIARALLGCYHFTQPLPGAYTPLTVVFIFLWLLCGFGLLME